jgi:phage-related minor tail protein
MEIFRVFGSLELRETGNIEGRLEQVTDSAGGVDTAFGTIGKGLGKLGKAFAGAASIITTVFIGTLTKATKFADDYNDSLQELSAATGTTGDSTEDLDKSLKNVYKAGYGDDIRDVAEAMREVKQQTGLTGDALEDQTEKVITLSKRMDLDYGETVKTVDGLMKNLNLTSDEAFELIVQGWEDGLNANGDYLDVLNEYAVQIDKAGLTADEFFSIMKAGHKNGVFSLDKLIDAQKEFNIRAVDGSEGTKEAYSDLGFSYDEYSAKIAKGGEEGKKAQQEIIKALLDEDDQVEQNKIGTALFGTMWEDLGPKGIGSLADIDDGLDNTKSHMDELDKTNFDTIGEAFSLIGRTIEVDFLLPIGKKVVPVVLEGIKKLKKGLIDFKGDLDNLKTKISDFGSGIAEKISPVVEAFNNIKKGVKGGSGEVGKIQDKLTPIINAFVTIKDALSEFIGAIGSGLSTVGGIIADSFKGFNFKVLEKAFKNIKDVMGPIIDTLKEFAIVIGGVVVAAIGIVVGVINGVVKAFDNIIGAVMNVIAFVGGAIGVLIGLFTGNWKLIGESFENMWNSLLDFFANVFVAIWDILSGFVEGVIGFFTGLYDKLVGNSIIPDMINGIIEWFAKLPGRIAAFVSNLVSSAVAKFNAFKNKVVAVVTNLINGAINIFKTIVSKIGNIISSLVSSAVSKFNSFKSKVVNVIRTLVSNARDTFKSIVSKIVSVISGLVSKAKTYFGKFKTAILNVLKGIDLKQMGINIVKGLVNGLKSMLKKVKDIAGKIGKAVTGAIKDKLKLKSPSKVMMDIGVNVVKGLSLGLEDSNAIANLKSSSDVMYKQLTPANAISNNRNNIRNITKSVNIDKIILDPKNIKELNDLVELFENLIHEKNMIST